MEVRAKEYEVHMANPPHPYKQTDNPQLGLKKYDVVESVKIDGEYSKVFTQDMDY